MKADSKYLAGTYLLMLIVIFLLPFFSVESYSIVKNTTSHLGAQHAPYAWIMNATFVLLGVFSIVGGWKFYRGFWFHRILLASFGISLVLAALYQHAPIETGIDYDMQEDRLHSLFSSITGFFFTLLAIATSFIPERKADKITALGIGITATALSVLMFQFPDWMGVWQRLIFILSFAWLIYIFRDKHQVQAAVVS